MQVPFPQLLHYHEEEQEQFFPDTDHEHKQFRAGYPSNTIRP